MATELIELESPAQGNISHSLQNQLRNLLGEAFSFVVRFDNCGTARKCESGEQFDYFIDESGTATIRRAE